MPVDLTKFINHISLNFTPFVHLININEKNKNKVDNILDKNGIHYEMIGRTQKDSLDLDEEFSIKISDLNELNTLWFKNYFMEN